MRTLVNKTARVVNVDRYMLVPGVAQKVGDLQSLISVYPGLKAMIDKGEIVAKGQEPEPEPEPQPQSQPSEVQTEEVTEALESAEDSRPKRRTARKKE